MYFALHHGHLTQVGLIPSLWVSVQFQQRAADVGKEIGALGGEVGYLLSSSSKVYVLSKTPDVKEPQPCVRSKIWRIAHYTCYS